ncbi:GNAT family N-acetyltransferase [Jiangella asiatica]|uniref:GNAT family N-acetyltransferase n=1 Tax=Jiangella asiatica TaxID=2530372 RepID=A0A4R5CLD0_9ACTN|nr:GNAT family N-acetyltransferase [Jiangella asiatica]TDD98264.1 GNAT family N-acetyltransferase [Jiangella asiatica]
MTVADDLTLRIARFTDLDAATLYRLLRLRVDVFVVEQGDAYPELDGRDPQPGTVHVWLSRGDEPVAYLRILDDTDGVARIGRVVVAADARGLGLAGRLMSAALDHIGDRPSVLAAQSHLADFYRRYGYEVTGPEFLDGHIPHLPMARPAPR